jgi:hypothetical protein
MSRQLKKVYFTLLLPLILGFILAGWAKSFNLIVISSADLIKIIGPSIFFLSFVLAIAFPLFFRTLFAQKGRHRISISEAELLKFERTLIDVVMITPYLALLSYFFELPRFYTASATLIGLYAVYYFYPSKKRIAFEKRVFRAN